MSLHWPVDDLTGQIAYKPNGIQQSGVIVLHIADVGMGRAALRRDSTYS